MSYFAKPNFIIYDEWFDYDLEKTKIDSKNKKIKNISKIHEFFYEQSNYKVGASENNFQLEIKVNQEELITRNYYEKTSEKYTSVSNDNFKFIKKLIKSTHQFNITKKLIFSLSILSFVFVFGFLIFFISQSNKNDLNIRNKSFVLEKGF